MDHVLKTSAIEQLAIVLLGESRGTSIYLVSVIVEERHVLLQNHLGVALMALCNLDFEPVGRAVHGHELCEHCMQIWSNSRTIFVKI